MIDIKIVRENPEAIRKDLKKRGDNEKAKLLEELIINDKELRELVGEADSLRQQRNAFTEEIAKMKRDGKDVAQKIQEMRRIPERIKSLDAEIASRKEKVDFALMRLPNMLHESVPAGKDETDNVQIRKWGKIPKFKFSIKDHIDLGTALGGIDVERAAKISGARFYFLKGNLALLDLAIMRFAIDRMANKGFELVLPPEMMRKSSYEGVTDLHDFEDVLYKIENEDLYLIATSEHPLVAMHSQETFTKNELPKKYTGFSINFRKEAGAHGKDTKGIFRVHQFSKVEQVVFCAPDESWKLHETLIRNAEAIFKELEIPYRIMNICTGDIGTVAAKKYDLEVWLSAQKRYREAVSGSNCTDYQTRRLGIKFREKAGSPLLGFVHTLNSTAVTDRALVAILENNQREDGSVKIPKALVKYMNGVKILRPPNK